MRFYRSIPLAMIKTDTFAVVRLGYLASSSSSSSSWPVMLCCYVMLCYVRRFLCHRISRQPAVKAARQIRLRIRAMGGCAVVVVGL